MGISAVAKAVDLAHFLTYHLPEFAVEYVRTHRYSFTWFIGQQTQYFGDVVRSVEAQIPAEITRFNGHQIEQHFHPVVAAFAAVDEGVGKAGSIRNLRRYDLIIGDFLVNRSIKRDPVVKHF